MAIKNQKTEETKMACEGISYPRANYFEMPNWWIELSPQILSLEELVVLQYIVRHTWFWWSKEILEDPDDGFVARAKDNQWITHQDLINGRIDRYGQRDDGVGLPDKIIQRGVNGCLQEGFISRRRGSKGMEYRLIMDEETKDGEV